MGRPDHGADSPAGPRHHAVFLCRGTIRQSRYAGGGHHNGHPALLCSRGTRVQISARLAAAYALAALGVLAKGLIAIAIPVLVIGIWLAAVGELRLILRLVWWPG